LFLSFSSSELLPSQLCIQNLKELTRSFIS
jgi:hypothetical protein